MTSHSCSSFSHVGASGKPGAVQPKKKQNKKDPHPTFSRKREKAKEAEEGLVLARMGLRRGSELVQIGGMDNSTKPFDTNQPEVAIERLDVCANVVRELIH